MYLQLLREFVLDFPYGTQFYIKCFSVIRARSSKKQRASTKLCLPKTNAVRERRYLLEQQ